MVYHLSNEDDHLWGYGLVYPDCHDDGDIETRDF